MADLGEHRDLRAVLASALKNRNAFQPEGRRDSSAFWPADHFGLDNVSLFRDSSEEERRAILEACGGNLLAESYYIEKFGMYFAAKMSLLAESADERMLYSLFAADEAVHYNWVAAFAPASAVADHLNNLFVKFLDETLRGEDRLTLSYVVQVVLEGWGLYHYRALSSDCEDEELKKVFENILRDEARHHRSGVILFGGQNPSTSQMERIVEVLSRLFFMVQAGPQAVVSQIERVRGPLSKIERARVFEELSCERATEQKIDLLKSLIGSAAHADFITDRLYHNGSLRAFSARECAEL
jgi:rubrerythrin